MRQKWNLHRWEISVKCTILMTDTNEKIHSALKQTAMGKIIEEPWFDR
jgi:hypothetical protein